MGKFFFGLFIGLCIMASGTEKPPVCQASPPHVLNPAGDPTQ